MGARGDGLPDRWRAPIGHATALPAFIDLDLLSHDVVWATAGTRHGVFGIEPHQLVAASRGLVVDLKHR